MPETTLLSIQTGRPKPLGPDAVPSGIVKRARSGPVRVGAHGLEGDEQADLSVHGGAEKAVYGYAAGHYPHWQREFPALHFSGGAFGENLTIAGLDESGICVGDIHAIGTACLQVCQPRQPCFKLGLLHGEEALPAAMVKNRRSGWYYRVIAEGEIHAGDALRLADRPHPDFPFARLVEIVYRRKAEAQELAAMAKMPALASQWRDWAHRHLQQ